MSEVKEKLTESKEKLKALQLTIDKLEKNKFELLKLRNILT